MAVDGLMDGVDARVSTLPRREKKGSGDHIFSGLSLRKGDCWTGSSGFVPRSDGEYGGSELEDEATSNTSVSITVGRR